MRNKIVCCLFALLATGGVSLSAKSLEKVNTKSGAVKGVISADNKVRMFKGIPFAAQPVGPLRWKAPQPVTPWKNVRDASAFGARCMQGNIFGDMVFRDNGPSEDCLYLNVWAPLPVGKKQPLLPVMVWIYGGGYAAGGSSEPRQDGEMLAHKGVVVVSFNYRLGLFGFLAHPGLAKETGRNGSGNYGLLDQVAALEWVQKNIKAFGGDPANVTIFGESAGSFSVCGLMASPLSKGLIKRAIGESGAFFGSSLAIRPASEAQLLGTQFAASAGASSIEELRAKPAAELMAAVKNPMGFPVTVDGSFFPEDARAIYAAGNQAHVSLLAGWNHDEGSYRMFFGKEEPTVQSYAAKMRDSYKDNADRMLELYPAANDEQAKESAQALSGDQFIGFSTWKWLEMQRATGKATVYRYMFQDAPPTNPSRGAYHSAEIEFVFEALPSKKEITWRPEDEKLSDLMSTYWTNFAKTGDPNGPGLPQWPAYSADGGNQVMHLAAESKAAPDQTRARYEFLDTVLSKK